MATAVNFGDWAMELTASTYDLLDASESYGAASENATPEPIYRGRILRHWLPTVPDAVAIGAYLLTATTLPLLDAIALGHAVGWDGSSHVGSLTADAEAAWERLTAHLDTLVDERENAGVHEASDWLNLAVSQRRNSDGDLVGYVIDNCAPDGGDAVITAQTTDEEIDVLVTEIESAAMLDLVLIDGTREYLLRLRGQL